MSWRWRRVQARITGREIAALGHDTRPIPPAYVKSFVKREKNDMADAEAICEAAQRPTMRFVQGKSAEAQASAVVVRTRDLPVRQRTQLVNTLGVDTPYDIITDFEQIYSEVLRIFRMNDENEAICEDAPR